MIRAADIVINEIRHEDLDQIMAIERTSFPTPWPRQFFDSELKSSYSFKRVSKIDNTIVGYIIAWKIYDEVHILNVAVHPQYRRMGIGTDLIRDCISYFLTKGVNSTLLEVRKTNLSAQRLYEKLGFQAIGLRRGYYRDTGEDAIVMQLKFECCKKKDNKFI